MWRFRPAALVSILLLPAIFAEDEGATSQKVFRAYDIGAIVLEPSAVMPPRRALPIERALADWELDEIDPDAEETAPLIHPENLVDLIRSFIRPESWGDEGASIDLAGDLLAVRAHTAVHDRISELLSALNTERQRRVLIRADLIELPEAAQASLPSLTAKLGGEEDVARARERLRATPGSRVLDVQTAIALPGQPIRLGRQREDSRLVDYEGEVAQESQIADPSSRWVETGTWIAVKASPTPGGESVLVDLSVSLSVLEDDPPLDPGAESVGVLHELGASIVRLRGSASVASHGGGSAWATTTPDGSGVICLLLQVTMIGDALTPVAGSETDALLFVDVSALTRRVAQTPFGTPWILDHANVDAGIEAMDDPPVHFLDEDQLVTHITEVLTAGRWEDNPSFFVQIENRHLMVHSDRGTVSEIRSWLLAQGASCTEAVELSVRRAIVDEDAYGRLLSSQGSGELDSRALEGVTRRLLAAGVTLLRNPIGWQAGIERSFVADYDVEIAQGSAIADPIVLPLFTGVRLNATPRSFGDGRYVVQLRGELTKIAARDVFTTRAPRIGTLQTPGIEVLPLTRDVIVRDGGTVIVAATALPESRHSERPQYEVILLEARKPL